MTKTKGMNQTLKRTTGSFIQSASLAGTTERKSADVRSVKPMKKNNGSVSLKIQVDFKTKSKKQFKELVQILAKSLEGYELDTESGLARVSKVIGA